MLDLYLQWSGHMTLYVTTRNITPLWFPRAPLAAAPPMQCYIVKQRAEHLRTHRLKLLFGSLGHFRQVQAGRQIEAESTGTRRTREEEKWRERGKHIGRRHWHGGMEEEDEGARDKRSIKGGAGWSSSPSQQAQWEGSLHRWKSCFDWCLYILLLQRQTVQLCQLILYGILQLPFKTIQNDSKLFQKILSDWHFQALLFFIIVLVGCFWFPLGSIWDQ